MIINYLIYVIHTFVWVVCSFLQGYGFVKGKNKYVLLSCFLFMFNCFFGITFVNFNIHPAFSMVILFVVLFFMFFVKGKFMTKWSTEEFYGIFPKRFSSYRNALSRELFLLRNAIDVDKFIHSKDIKNSLEYVIFCNEVDTLNEKLDFIQSSYSSLEVRTLIHLLDTTKCVSNQIKLSRDKLPLEKDVKVVQDIFTNNLTSTIILADSISEALNTSRLKVKENKNVVQA